MLKNLLFQEIPDRHQVPDAFKALCLNVASNNYANCWEKNTALPEASII